jgi:hypothetical protein
MIDAPIRYARSGAVEIAYRTLGEGPIDLVFVQGWLTHLQVLSEEPAYRRLCEALSGFCRLILFDKRGMGLSDRTEVGALEDRMDDVRAILDDVGSERAVLFGNSEGGPTVRRHVSGTDPGRDPLRWRGQGGTLSGLALGRIDSRAASGNDGAGARHLGHRQDDRLRLAQRQRR